MAATAGPPDPTTRRWLFGTDEEPAAELTLQAGRLEVAIAGGAVAAVRWDGVEAVRGVDYPVRDADWATLPTEELSASHASGPSGLRYERSFVAGPFVGTFACQGGADGTVTLRLRLTAEAPARVSRAGFVVLHPPEVAGTNLRVRHVGGDEEASGFPRLIAPAQPATDIAGLDHERGGVAVGLRFEGEVFEMEDQRNWTDASFKTYCRPLRRPCPYDVAEGEAIEQAITLRLSGRADQGRAATSLALVVTGPGPHPVPRFALALDPAWPLRGRLGPLAGPFGDGLLLARVDLADPAALDWLAEVAPSLAGRPLDLEAIADGDPDRLEAQVAGLARRVAELGLAPSHVVVLPRGYLRSIQPWQPPPPGATPSDAIAVAGRHFPGARIGAGMLTNFTELNRCPPEAGAGHYVTHALTPLVHAADDLSVMRALDALDPVFATLDTLAHGRPFRLGLASIGMRTNPYGAGVAENPGQVRLPMAGADPRQRGLFAAAWMVGVAAATRGRPFEAVALAAPYGPFGLAHAPGAWRRPGYDEDEGLLVHPAFHAYRALLALSGRRRLGLDLPDGLTGVAAARPGGLGAPAVDAVLANRTGSMIELALPEGAATAILDATTAPAAARDPGWLDRAERTRARAIALGPYAVAIAELPKEEEP